MLGHVHEFVILKADGLGWRCLCGELREDVPSEHVWAATPLDPNPPDHAHEFVFLERDGWHCRVCGARKTEA